MFQLPISRTRVRKRLLILRSANERVDMICRFLILLTFEANDDTLTVQFSTEQASKALKAGLTGTELVKALDISS
ncbi:MAG: hypothetical protein M1358_20855 [Chloroflexi bacterium]|nr:hypothetical protein [Chloroflexota bacterium]